MTGCGLTIDRECVSCLPFLMLLPIHMTTPRKNAANRWFSVAKFREKSGYTLKDSLFIYAELRYTYGAVSTRTLYLVRFRVGQTSDCAGFSISVPNTEDRRERRNTSADRASSTWRGRTNEGPQEDCDLLSVTTLGIRKYLEIFISES